MRWKLCCDSTNEQSKVVLVTGPTCSGKTTIATKLAEKLNPDVENPKVIAADDYFDYDSFANDTCTMTTVGDHTWKNWEVPNAVNWEALVKEVEDVKRTNQLRYVVVEGFLICGNDRLMELASAVIHIDLPNEEIWRRRLARAKSLRGLPEKMGAGTNYEVLHVYTTSQNYARCKSAADRIINRMPKDDREYAWLRLYFEELIEPTVKEQSIMRARHHQCLVLDGTNPAKEEVWTEDAILKCQQFLAQPVS